MPSPKSSHFISSARINLRVIYWNSLSVTFSLRAKSFIVIKMLSAIIVLWLFLTNSLLSNIPKSKCSKRLKKAKQNIAFSNIILHYVIQVSLWEGENLMFPCKDFPCAWADELVRMGFVFFL